MDDRVVATTRQCVRARRLDRELNATAPLASGESVLAEGVVRSRTSGLPRLSYLRVSASRICVVQHFAFRPDRLIEIPPTALLHAPTVQGSWIRLDAAHTDGTPAVSLGTSALGFKQRPGTTWTGDLAGTTTYVAYTRSDPKRPGAGLGTIDEVFTGAVNGIGHGHLYLRERFTVAAKGGAIRNAARITRSDGGLNGVSGTIVFVGTLDVTADGSVAVSGLGHGTYTGTLTH